MPGLPWFGKVATRINGGKFMPLREGRLASGAAPAASGLTPDNVALAMANLRGDWLARGQQSPGALAATQEKAGRGVAHTLPRPLTPRNTPVAMLAPVSDAGVWHRKPRRCGRTRGSFRGVREAGGEEHRCIPEGTGSRGRNVAHRAQLSPPAKAPGLDTPGASFTLAGRL